MKAIVFVLKVGKHLTLKSEPVAEGKELYFKRQIKMYYNNLLGSLVGIIITEETIDI